MSPSTQNCYHLYISECVSCPQVECGIVEYRRDTDDSYNKSWWIAFASIVAAGIVACAGLIALIYVVIGWVSFAICGVVTCIFGCVAYIWSPNKNDYLSHSADINETHNEIRRRENELQLIQLRIDALKTKLDARGYPTT